MTQNIGLDHEDIVHEGFFDPIQELLGASAPSLRIKVQNATTLQIVASTGNDQQTVAVDGRYRWRTTNTTAALPGGLANGTHPVFVTASDNDFSGPVTDPDAPTDYSFGLEVKAVGNTPSTVLWRQVGEVDVVSSTITAFRQLVGPRPRGDGPISAVADHATQSPMHIRGIASQSAPLVLVENSAGTDLFTIAASGDVTFAGSLTVNGASGIALNTAKITGLATPTVATDAATKGYVDGIDTVAAGAGLTEAGGNTIDVGEGTGIDVTADAVAIDTAVVPRLAVDNAFTGRMTVTVGSASSALVVSQTSTGPIADFQDSSTSVFKVDDGSKIGFFNVTTVARQSATTDIKDALTSYGLLQGTSASPLNLDGGTLTAGVGAFSGLLTASLGLSIADAQDVTIGTGTGTKIGQSGSKLAFFGVTPATRPGATAEIKAALASLGLLTDGGVSPLDLDGGALAAGTGAFSGLLTASLGLSIIDAQDVTIGTGTGTKIGQASSKLAFFGVTPAARPSATTEIKAALASLGLLTDGGASPLDLDGGALTAAAGTFSGLLTASSGLSIPNGQDVTIGTGTGTKIGQASSKIGLFGVTPVARPAGWTIINDTADRTFDANVTSINELADVVATLIRDMAALGATGAVA